MPELADIYSDRILERAANIARVGRLAAPAATATLQSKLCGSTVTVDIVVADGRVTDYAHTVKACLLGQASAAIMAETIIGATPDELRRVRDELAAMLKQGAPPPGGRWSALAMLEPVREVKGRHASTLLVFDAVVRALAEIDARATVA